MRITHLDDSLGGIAVTRILSTAALIAGARLRVNPDGG